MTARDRVLTALEHQTPDRTPFSWGFCCTGEMSRLLDGWMAEQGLDWHPLRRAAEHIVRVAPDYIGPDANRGSPGRDIWGIKTQRSAYDGGEYAEFCDFPLAGITSPSEIDAYPWPQADWFDADTLAARIEAANPARERAVMYAPAGNPFEIYSWMTGLEEAMVNLLVAPEVVHAALDQITTFFADRLVTGLKVAGDLIDLVFLADDVGGQTGPLMSSATYRSMLQPYHRRLIETVKNTAPHVRCAFHTDGSVYDLLDDLLDSGIDVLEAVQIDAAGMEPARLKSGFGDRVCFHGGVSVQQLLPHHAAETVRAECIRLCETFGAGGGYVAAPSHAMQVGTPPENVLAMLEGVFGEAYGEVVTAARR